ncbi:MAG TPA: hypothetical protein VGV63_12430 [Acidimicrobiales bacterium]|nr:hypothetical protein [Acidimicrobiales bacterium]
MVTGGYDETTEAGLRAAAGRACTTIRVLAVVVVALVPLTLVGLITVPRRARRRALVGRCFSAWSWTGAVATLVSSLLIVIRNYEVTTLAVGSALIGVPSSASLLERWASSCPPWPWACNGSVQDDPGRHHRLLGGVGRRPGVCGPGLRHRDAGVPLPLGLLLLDNDLDPGTVAARRRGHSPARSRCNSPSSTTWGPTGPSSATVLREAETMSLRPVKPPPPAAGRAGEIIQ